MWPPTRLIPWFSKTEGNTYATLLHHPLLFGENQRSAQEVALDSNLFTHRNTYAILREATSETYGPRVYFPSY